MIHEHMHSVTFGFTKRQTRCLYTHLVVLTYNLPPPSFIISIARLSFLSFFIFTKDRCDCSKDININSFDLLVVIFHDIVSFNFSRSRLFKRCKYYYQIRIFFKPRRKNKHYLKKKKKKKKKGAIVFYSFFAFVKKIVEIFVLFIYSWLAIILLHVNIFSYCKKETEA